MKSKTPLKLLKEAMVENNKTELLKKIADSETLPALSPLAIKLVELAADDSSSATDLAGVIEKDPGLTTRLLKMVGSAFFSRSETITSIAQAVVLVGFKKVRIMALSLSLRDAFAMDKTENMNYQLFWKTSLYRALIAKDFVQAEQPEDGLVSEEAFMAGLIAEIGLLLLFSQCPNTKKKDFPGNDLSLEKTIAWEEKNLGINHRELGSIVLKRWRFPETLVESQKCYGANALNIHAPALCKTVELARRATDVVFGETAALSDYQALVQKTIRLDPETVNSILARAFGKVEEMAQQLQVEVDSQKDILAVMERANQALVRINSSMETALSGLLDNVDDVDLPTDGPSEQKKHGRDILQNTLDAVAHEIRNPLLAIGGFSRRLAREAEGKGRGSEYAKIIAEESARLEGILREVTEYCQDYRPGMGNEDLVHLVTHVLEETNVQLKKQKIQISRDFPNEPVLVSAERKGMAQALRLLLDNAANGLGKTGKGLINVTICPEHRGISVNIADNGRPMSNEIRDVLVDGNLSAKTFGKGLKLAMARKVVEAHGGRISLAVEEGQGNRVTLWLPAPP